MDLSDHGLNRGLIGDVGLDADRLPAGGDDLVGRAVGGHGFRLRLELFV